MSATATATATARARAPYRDRASTRQSAWWWVALVLALMISAYGLAIILVGGRMYPPMLSASFLARPWRIYPHALFGALALALGPLQFHRRLRARRLRLHRVSGRLYVAFALVTGIVGLYMSRFAFGGWVTTVGFGGLALSLIVSTVRAYTAARARDIETHRRWMLRSYALLFSAVTLRLELPPLTIALGGFLPAYRVVAWSA